ncbi:hypothetical protein K32_32520 [Kaistia sp. 32K]|nr:hypothetical protein K32_32520 [Kaistia sp. 32K]
MTPGDPAKAAAETADMARRCRDVSPGRRRRTVYRETSRQRPGCPPASTARGCPWVAYRLNDGFPNRLKVA